MKKLEEIESKMDELRNQAVATATMMTHMAHTPYEVRQAKIQGDKLSESWNEFLNEWKELQKELQIEALDKDIAESSEEKSEFIKLTGLIKKAF